MTEPGLLTRVQAGLGFGFLIVFAAASLWAGFGVPYRDDWDWLFHTLSGPGGVGGLFVPHNEHVIPFARLLMSAQYALGGLHGRFVQYVALACYLLTVWVFWREVGRRWPDRPHWRRGVGGVVLVCLGFTQQLQSIVFAASVLFPLVQVAVTLAIVALLNATGTAPAAARRRWWGIAAVWTGIAALSTTSGLAVPIVLAALAWWRGASWRVVAVWIAAGVGLALGYAGWVGLDKAGLGDGAVVPWDVSRIADMLAYGLAIFSAGLSFVHPGAAVVAGALVVTGVAVAGVLAIRRPGRLTRLEVFALGQMAFGMASAIMLAPGRSVFGVAQAGQSRYATFVLCAIAGLVLFFASRFDRLAFSRRVQVALVRTTVALSLLLIVPNLYVALLWRSKADLLDLAYLSIRSGVTAPEWIESLHPFPFAVDRVLARVQASGVPVVDPRVMTAGPAPVPAASCGGRGHLEPRHPDGGLWMTGVWPPALNHGVIIDASGTIVGLSRPLPWVSAPNPSPRLVHQTVLRRVRAVMDGRPDGAWWGGFAQAGAGPPYRWVAGGTPGRWSCSDALDVLPDRQPAGGRP